MRDTELVASIVAGDPDGLAAAYDRYADALYTYCRTFLPDPADAADAVQDTFVLAASKIEHLRDPERLRSWLYAIARNQCLRQLRASKRTSALDDAPEVADDSADVDEDVARAERTRLVQDALPGLNASEREVIELQLRHQLEPAEMASVLGVSRNHVHSLLSRGRDQLEACLAVLVVGKTGRADCDDLGSMLSDWDGHLTVLLRKRVNRHIQHCATCTRRRAFALKPAAFFGSGGLSLAILATPTLLKGEVLRLGLGTGAAAAAHRAAVISKAGAFGGHGFPKVAPAAKSGYHLVLHHVSQGPAVAAGGVVAVVTAGSLVLAVSGGGRHVTLTEGGPPAKPPASASAVAQEPLTPSRPASSSLALASTATSPTATATSTSPVSVLATGSATPTQSPTPPPITGGTSVPTATPTAVQGTLTVSPDGGILHVPSGGSATITLTAAGGPVAWSASLTGGKGQVLVSPSSGYLSDGQSATVTVSGTPPVAGAQLTISPASVTFQVRPGQGPVAGQRAGSTSGLPGIILSAIEVIG
jgi:RNA polymerase sigma factor (sigma-70 family)